MTWRLPPPECGGMDVSGRNLEPARGASLRLEGEHSPEAAGVLWGRMLLRCKGLPPAGAPFGLLHRERGEYEACWPLPPGHPLNPARDGRTGLATPAVGVSRAPPVAGRPPSPAGSTLNAPG